MIIDYSRAKKKARWLRYGIACAMVFIVLNGLLLALPDGVVPGGPMFDFRQRPPVALADHPHLFLIANSLIALIYLAGLFRLIKLMRLFEEGEFFSARGVRHLRAFALSLLLASIAGCVLPPLLLMGARMLGVDHVTVLRVGLENSDMWQGFISAVFFVVAMILGEARQLAEDNQLIV